MASAVGKPTNVLPGISASIAALNARIQEIATQDGMVFVTGEPGTEKALAAKCIHQLSTRAERPIARASVSWKLPNDMAERFAACDGGTLIVNLTKELPIDMQYTMLEMANDRTFTDPLSGDVVEADVRIILTTSLDLEHLAGKTQLLPELTELLQDCHLEIPPLRERPEDIPAMVRYATQRAYDTGRTKARAADPQVLALFRSWRWPGNTEDLLLVTAEAALNTSGNRIAFDDLPQEFLKLMPKELVEAARQVKVSHGGLTPDETTVDDDEAMPARPMAKKPEEPAFDPVAMLAKTLGAAPGPNAITPGDLPKLGEEPTIVLPAGFFATPATPAPVLPPPPLVDEPTPVPHAAPAVATLGGALADDTDIEQLAALVEPERAPRDGEDQTSDLATREETYARQMQRLYRLARRLSAQSQVLAQQMSGPLERRFPVNEVPEDLPKDPEEKLVASLEDELDRGLNQILALRRQLALLNKREQDSLVTASDLYRRLVLAGQDIQKRVDVDEIRGETTELAGSLRDFDAVLRRIRQSFPDAENMAGVGSVSEKLRREETEIVAEAIRRAKEGEEVRLSKVTLDLEDLRRRLGRMADDEAAGNDETQA